MLVLKRDEAPPQERTPELQTLIGKGCSFEGKLTFEGMVRIDGHFKGEVRTKDTLIITSSAVVEANISAGTVIVHGTVEGDITASALVELHPPARVRGNIETPSLSVEKGVLFDGACRMESGRSKDAPPPLPERRGRADAASPLGA